MWDTNLKSGWQLAPMIGAVCHFEHRPEAQLLELLDVREQMFVIETVNSSAASSEAGCMHFNKYFAHSLREAIGLAARMEIDLIVVAEEIVGIRPATEDEVEMALKVHHHLYKLTPAAISDQQAQQLEGFEDDEE